MDVRRVVTGLHRLWGGDGTPQFPDDGSIPGHHMYLPPIGGFRFGMFSLPPAGAAASDVPAAVGLADFEVVLEGTVVLELDDGAEVTLSLAQSRRRNHADRGVHVWCSAFRRFAA